MSRKARPFGTFNDDDESDSDDSDYCPGSQSPDEEDVLTKSQKRKATKTTKSVSPRKKPTKRAVRSEKLSISNGSHILAQFPPEILVKVFQYGVWAEGVTQLVPRMAQVCQMWREVSCNPLVWSRVCVPSQTLTLNAARLAKLRQFDLSCCRHLDISGQKIKENLIMEILECTPSLRFLNLSNCIHLKPAVLLKLPALCPHLARLNLSFLESFNSITVSSLEHFITQSGHRLVELRLARISCVLTSARKILKAIETHCPNMEVLDLSVSGCSGSSQSGQKLDLDADTFFQKCPKIADLTLDGFNFVRPKPLGPTDKLMELKNLQSYSQGCNRHETSDSPVFYRLFGSTQSLQSLDVSSSKLLPSLVTGSLKAVTQLSMSAMAWRDSEHGQLFDVLEAWKYSLVSLDLSCNIFVDSALDAALLVYAVPDTFPLRLLNLKYTNVTATSIQNVVKHCTELQEIDLTSCRELPRGCKHHVYRAEFKFLEKCLRRS